MDAVVIASPYRGEDCKAKAGAGQQPGVLPRVKKVVSSISRDKILSSRLECLVADLKEIRKAFSGEYKANSLVSK